MVRFIRTRIPDRVYEALVKMADSLDKSPYQLAREILEEGVDARLGLLEQEIRMARDLEGRRAAALSGLREEAEKRQEEMAVKAEEERVETLHPADRVVAFLNGGKVQDALDEFSNHPSQAAQEVILDHVRKQPGLPGVEEFLARAGRPQEAP